MSNSSKIIERIKREIGEDVYDLLAEKMSAPDLQSLLLEVYRRRVELLQPHHLFKQFKENRFVQPSSINPKLYIKLDDLAYSLASEYEAVELSPLSPLGCNSIIAPVDQNNAVSTIRNTEVCSDSTNVLALIAAQLRAELLKENPKSEETIKLCASFRVVRGQFVEGRGFVPHFRLFSMITAGRDSGSFFFETGALFEHIDFYLTYLSALEKLGIHLKNKVANITDFVGTREARLGGEALAKLRETHADVTIQFDPDRTQGSGYYFPVGFQIIADDHTGENILLVDGGFTDWTQQLLNNKKERLLISGLGTERLCLCF